MHKTELHPDTIDVIMKRRGKLHVHDSLDASRTAMVVIDMQRAFLEEGRPSEVPMAREIVPTINRLGDELRRAGGVVAWVYSTMTEETLKEWESFFGGTYSDEKSKAVINNLTPGREGHEFWPEMDVRDEDLKVEKNRFSAFLPGAADTEAQLKARGIDNVLMVGTLTNVCCESSARDAMQLNFNVVMVSDGNATYTDAIHNAALSSMAITIADVMTADEVIQRLVPAARAAAE